MHIEKKFATIDVAKEETEADTKDSTKGSDVDDDENFDS